MKEDLLADKLCNLIDIKFIDFVASLIKFL